MNRRVQKSPKCQRCLEEGHWSFECTNPPSYVYRPSARAVYFNPELKKKINTSPDEEPKNLKKSQVQVVKARSRSRSSVSSSSAEKSD